MNWLEEWRIAFGFYGSREGEHLNVTEPYPFKRYLPILAQGQS